MSVAQARAVVAERLAGREANLLRTLRGAIFGHRPSPYRQLFEWAGCELGDVERMLRADGVDASLGALHGAGVHVSFEEFKGRRPIVRGGRELAVGDRDFDNPLVRGGLPSGSSGTTGAPSKSYHDLGHILETVPFRLLSAEAHGMRGAPTAFWFSPPPSIAGINSALSGVVMGYPPERWWAPTDGDERPPLRQRVATRSFLALARLHGVRFPTPEALPLERPEAIVEWAAAALARAGRCEIRAFASTAMRIARAASELGVDLTGARIVCGGEAASPAKQRVIEACGARMISFYGIAECGPIGMTCPAAGDARDLHVSTDRMAVVERPVALADWGLSVPGLFLTSLLPGSPKVMLNVESDDCGVLERRACGCAFERWGLGAHLRDVRSYRRLTAEGVTLVPEPARRALEELLPARFGGTPLDYQLREEEGPDGLSRVSLLVSPEVELDGEELVANALLDALGAGDAPAAAAARFWRHAGSLRVLRERPLVTAGGKQLPIVVAGLGSRPTPSSPRPAGGPA